MAVYRDSQLGLCLDVTGPDGNIFFVMAAAENLAQQIGNLEDWREAVKALRLMDATYLSHLYLFQEYFPIVTLIGFDEVKRIEEGGDPNVEED